MKDSKRPGPRGLRILYTNFRMIVASMILLALVLGASIWFSTSYNSLNRSIQNERVDSVSQIGIIILEKIQLLSESYCDSLEESARLFTSSSLHSMEQAKTLFGSTDELCVFFRDGSCKDLSGNAVYFLDVPTIYDYILSGDTGSHFGSLRTRGDYWIFSTPVQGVSLDGKEVVGLLRLVDEQTYTKVTTNAIFGDRGATYVVSSGGVILLRPDDQAVGSYFQSFNMLSDLEAQKAPDNQIQILRTALAEGKSAQIKVELQGETWLIQSVPDNSQRSLVLAVPISITARETFESMRSSILAIVMAALCLALLALVWIMYFIHRDGEMRLEQAKASSKSDFMSKISHDIRTPLNAIVGMIEIAQISIDNRDIVQDSLTSAKKSSEYLISIINDVLDMSRIESGKMVINHHPFELKALLHNVMQIQSSTAAAKGLRLELKDSTKGGMAHVGDEVRIKQCLINLLSNAVKFTDKGGSVTLYCDEKPGDDGGSLIRFVVEDTGIGMSEEFMERIFSPFEQEHSSVTAGGSGGQVGSGLGLSIVYNLMNLMGGTVRVESQRDRGSRFTLELPLAVTEPEAAAKEVLPQVSPDHLQGRRVLLAEDNALNRSIATFLLENMGIAVDCAQNGRQALEMFEASKPGWYDLILMDIQMPVMDGLEATGHIRASAHPDAGRVPIIALSANAFREDAEKSRLAGMQDHLPKPIDPAELQAALIKNIK